MLFRKVGAEKEEGRLKEDSLSETLRVLETATGLGRENAHKLQIPKKNKKRHYTKERAFGQSTEKTLSDQKTVTGNG